MAREKMAAILILGRGTSGDAGFPTGAGQIRTLLALSDQVPMKVGFLTDGRLAM